MESAVLGTSAGKVAVNGHRSRGSQQAADAFEAAPIVPAVLSGRNNVLPHFKHSWTASPGGGLNSTCSRCSAVLGRNMDEIALLELERKHVCR